jgi:lantibiotic modifying enzyme
MNHIKSPRPLVGLAHGAAGIALALLELATATGEARFRTAAEQAIAYERALFLPALGTWADPHHPETDAPSEATTLDHFIHGWCYGAPGIGLARLAALPHLDDPLLYDEIQAATAVALKASFGYNHSLCHGDLGNLELLMQASAVSPDAHLLSAVQNLTSSVLEQITQHGWICAVPMAVETPGLMIGLAGIGYGLLRLARPNDVPSVLQLAAPIPATSAGLVATQPLIKPQLRMVTTP